jgi:hypothetical protein
VAGGWWLVAGGWWLVAGKKERFSDSLVAGILLKFVSAILLL